MDAVFPPSSATVTETCQRSPAPPTPNPAENTAENESYPPQLSVTKGVVLPASDPLQVTPVWPLHYQQEDNFSYLQHQQVPALPPRHEGDHQQIPALPPHHEGGDQQAVAPPPSIGHDTQQVPGIHPCHGGGVPKPFSQVEADESDSESESDDEKLDELRDHLWNVSFCLESFPHPAYSSNPTFLAKLGATPPPHGQWEAFLSGLVGPLPGGQPSDEVFNWLSGELPAQKQIANMTYEELLKLPMAGEWEQNESEVSRFPEIL